MDPLLRFRLDFARLLPRDATAGEPFGLAVSGGPDSMAMLWLAANAFPGRVVAATVDHGLRPASADEAELASVTCATLGIPHATLRSDLPIAGGNLHAAAREIRYELLARWADGAGARVLATAHHMDDQAETFLMRAIRGSGVPGLSGVRARRRHGALTIIRPLLGWRRTDLRAIVTTSGLAVATDPSNADERFERTRVRHMLAEQPLLDAAGLAAAARHVGEAETALAETADWLWRTRARVESDHVVLEVDDMPRELRRRLVRRALAERSPSYDPAANIEPLLDALDLGRAATQGGVLVRPKGGRWRFTEAPPRRVGH